MSNLKPTRRAFIAATATALSAAAQRRTLGANDLINAAIIGVGNIGSRHLKDRLLPMMRQDGAINVVAASDIYDRAKLRAKEMIGLADKDVHHNYEDLLARNDVDAVVIATPDHWHAKMAIDAMNAGKDVYLEKPMTYTIEEAKQVSETVKRTGAVLQVGSQYVSDPAYHEAKKVIEKGWIGPILFAQSSFSSNNTDGVWQYYVDEEATPATVDWERFLGSAPKQPFSPERFFRWRKYWDFSGGMATDFYYHRLSPMLYTLGPRFPTRVSAHGGIYRFENRQVPDTYLTTAEYEDFCITLVGTCGSGASDRLHAPAVYGHEATIDFQRGAIEVRPESIYRDKFIAATGKPTIRIEVPNEDQLYARRKHMENFLECVRTRERPRFHAEFGYQVMVAIKLGVDSYRQGKMMAFDPATERILDAPPPREPGFEGDGTNNPDAPDQYQKRPIG